MTENVPVRCPVCRREHAYVPPVYPCPCGAPVAPPLLRGGVPVRIHHRVWADSWLTLRCASCGRYDEWPRPELGCPCGALLRLPLAHDHASPVPGAAPAGSLAGPPADTAGLPEAAGVPGTGHPAPQPPPGAAPRTAARERPAFRPVTIRTARDAVTAAARYLDWLGFERVRTTTESHPASGVDLRGPEVLARVDPTTSPVGPATVETLWLHGLNESAVALCFSLAGYTTAARTRADVLGLPLFVMDLTGTPQPVNDTARELVRTGAPR
ncbi:hypothetical protein V1L54_16755 [Streptomyces sp. TRM 70361]|uniref:hypothetical protein n=1 Tax=Streptomyces sp. TRM 70361 TaxID=3116553 RepID=UPI002E7BDB29|nr:hypothetical protein [Streptomyces sp. TRM 70361]MEE1941033.1 hypothetical protein [Streptomyces sp. TRM 70361]